MKNIILLILLLVSFQRVSASLVTITGNAPDYAGRHLVVSYYADYISRLKKDLATISVQSDGSFSASIEISEITYVFIDLSSYTAHMYLEPDAQYEVVLPPFKLRPDAERFNPYYRPKEVSLGMKSATSNLNQAIKDFDLFFGRIYGQNAQRLVRMKDNALCDRLLERTDSCARAINCEKTYFKNHVKYRQAQLYATTRLHAERKVLSQYFIGCPVLYNLPAYWQVIEMLNPDIVHDINKADIRKLMRQETMSETPQVSRISEILTMDTLWRNDQTLREALIIKSVFGDFYNSSITTGRADTLLLSAAQDCKSIRNRLMAANIYAKKNKLRVGLPAPELDLVDNDDRTIKLSDYKGRFLYIAFMHTENFECIKVMPALDNLALLHKADMDVLCIFTDDKADDMYRQLKKSNYTWRGVSYIANQKIMLEYEVAALPTYFLIDPDGCIAMAQAPGPTEKVGPAIAHAIREYQIATKRGRPEIPRTIYDIANESH